MANRLLGVISALPEELAHLSDLSGTSSEIGGLAFWRGEIAGREAVALVTPDNPATEEIRK